jgi:hypothetical protein
VRGESSSHRKEQRLLAKTVLLESILNILVPLYAQIAQKERTVFTQLLRTRILVLIVKQASTQRVTVPQSASLAPLESSTLIQEHHTKMPAQTVKQGHIHPLLQHLVQTVLLETSAPLLDNQIVERAQQVDSAMSLGRPMILFVKPVRLEVTAP